MNCIKQSIWNRKVGVFVSVSAKARPVFSLKVLAISILISLGANAYALPVGGSVSAGAANIGSGTGSMTITQSTQNTAINWQSFNIGQNEAVHFVQPNSSSVALNRVMGSDPSSILGNLSANGKVFLVNPNGILFGKGAQVNVGGLLASTLNISDSDFMSGNYKFSGTGNGTILNHGTISTNADGGYVALLGANVSNDGIISARLGTVALAAGTAITLDMVGDGLLNVTVNQGAVKALVQNGGLIKADGGLVLLTTQAAGSLLQSVVNNTGVIQAQSIQNINGTIKLLGDRQSGTVMVGGTLDASGTGTGQTGGSVTATGQHVGLFGGHINTSGDAGGGTVLIGGDLHGANSAIPNASATYVSADSTINADAITAGDGGKVIVWADDINRYYGNISARGGVQGGDGGFTEVSGKNNLLFGGYVDLRAPGGKTGTLLLDPLNLTIQAAGPDLAGNSTGLDLNAAVNKPNIFSLTDYLGINSIITTGQVVTQLNTANVTLQATNDITVAAAIDASLNAVGKSLTLQAGHDVIINAALTAASVGGGSFILNAGHNVTVGAAITASAGSVTLSAGNNGTGPGVASGTVSFTAVTAANLTIRFNPVNYTTTSAEILAYLGNATFTGTFDARAWTFINNASATAQSKTYNGTTAASLNAPFTFLSGPDGSAGQAVSLTAGAANFDSAHVTSATTVNFTGYGLSAGGDSANYALFAQPASQLKTITPAQLTAAATISGAAKTYDGLLVASGSMVSGSITGGLVGSDTVALDTSGISLNFSNAHVVPVKTIAATGNAAIGAITTSGSGSFNGSAGNLVVSVASDYTLGQPTIASVAGTINAKALVESATISGAAKTYDGLLAASGSTVSGSITSGQVGTDTVSLDSSGISLNFSSAHVAPAKTIIATGNAAIGAITTSGSGSFDGSAGNLVVSATSDYVLGQPTIASVAGTINAAPLSFTGTRAYDATLNFAANTFGTAGTIAALGTETLLLSGTGTVVGKDVGGGKAVTTTGLTLHDVGATGGLASDYTFVGGTQTATITTATLTLSGTQVYNGSTAYAGSNLTATGVAGETFTITGAGLAGNLASKNVQSSSALTTLNGLTLGSSGNGGLAANYNAMTTTGSLVNVSKAGLLLSGTQVYNGSTAYAGANLTATGIAGETFAITGAGLAGNLVVKDVQSGSSLTTLNGLTLGSSGNGGLAANYNAMTTTGSLVNVSKASLLLSGITANNKVYDGNTSATINSTGASYSGLITGDAVTVSSSGVFADKNAATGKTVTLSSVYSGADVGNYSITNQASTSANISTKALGISGIAAGNKVYDGNTSATINSTAANYSGLVTGDAVTVSSSGVFADNNVGAGKTVTLTSLYSGADVRNYSITNQASTSANITANVTTSTTTGTTTSITANTTVGTPSNISSAPVTVKLPVQSVTVIVAPVIPVIAAVANNFELSGSPILVMGGTLTDESYERKSSIKPVVKQHHRSHKSNRAITAIKSKNTSAVKASPVTNAIIPKALPLNEQTLTEE